MLMMQILTQTDNHDLGGNVATNKKWSLKKKKNGLKFQNPKFNILRKIKEQKWLNKLYMLQFVKSLKVYVTLDPESVR